MCEFCAEHGEGKRWYENARNYSAELLADPTRQRYLRGFIRGIEKNHMRNERLLRGAKRLLPGPYRFLRRHILEPRQKRIHYGQVLPLEDVETVFDLTGKVARFPCVCRKTTTGREVRHCFAVGFEAGEWLDPYPDYKAGLEILTPTEAKEAVRRLDVEGKVHTIWTMMTPFIGGVCNCDGDCLAFRVQRTHDLMTVMLHGESVAAVDSERCSGCGACAEVCRFDAIAFPHGVAEVSREACYGCGLCRERCSEEAIALGPRRPAKGSTP